MSPVSLSSFSSITRVSSIASSRRSRMAMTWTAALAIVFLASTVRCNQPVPPAPVHGLKPPQAGVNGSPRPVPARRARDSGTPDPLDAHLDRVFSNFDDKNGKEDSLWDRIKRNFVDEDGKGENTGVAPSSGKPDELQRRTWWKSEGTLIKPKWLAKVYEIAIVIAKGIVKVLNKEYPTHYLIDRIDVALDIVDRLPYILDRLIPILDIADALPFFLGHLVETAQSLRPVNKMLPRVERLITTVEKVDINGLVYNSNQLLHRVQKLPLERMVELLFNLSAEFKSITDLVKQAQALLPSLLPIFLNRGAGGSSSSTPAPETSPVVFFPPLDGDQPHQGDDGFAEPSAGASGQGGPEAYQVYPSVPAQRPA